MRYIFVVLVSLGLFACNNIEKTQQTDDDIQLSDIAVLLNKTEYGNESGMINSVLINITDDGGTIIVSKLVNKDTTLNSDWHRLITSGQGLRFVNITQLSSKVYVYGNPGNAVVNNVIDREAANRQKPDILYYGHANELTLPTSNLEKIDSTDRKIYIAKVTLAPVASYMDDSKITLNKTKNAPFGDMTRSINYIQ